MPGADLQIFEPAVSPAELLILERGIVQYIDGKDSVIDIVSAREPKSENFQILGTDARLFHMIVHRFQKGRWDANRVNMFHVFLLEDLPFGQHFKIHVIESEFQSFGFFHGIQEGIIRKRCRLDMAFGRVVIVPYHRDLNMAFRVGDICLVLSS